jgi:hypothetical protein
MTFGTVFPEMAMGFAESVTHAVQVAETKEWSAEDVRQVVAACREVRQKFDAMGRLLRDALVEGVDAATFVRQEEPHLARLEKLLSQHAAILAEADRIQAPQSGHGEFLAEFEAMGKAMSGVRDLLRQALSAMTTPRRPVDWQRVQEAQAAHVRGETRPLEATPAPNGD